MALGKEARGRRAGSGRASLTSACLAGLSGVAYHAGMTPTIDMDAIRKLSVADRLKLIDAIWETLADQDADIPVSDEVLTEMRRRVQELKDNPDSGMSLEEAREFLRNRSGR
jgi:putative addiction module component (TIGR02574 family)